MNEGGDQIVAASPSGAAQEMSQKEINQRIWILRRPMIIGGVS